MITTINEFRRHINNVANINEKHDDSGIKTKDEYKNMLLQYLQHRTNETSGRLSIIKVKGDVLRSMLFGKLTETMSMVLKNYDREKIIKELVILQKELESAYFNKTLELKAEKIMNAYNFEGFFDEMFAAYPETKNLDTFNKIVKYFDPSFDAVQELGLPKIKFKTGKSMKSDVSYKEFLPKSTWAASTNNPNLYPEEQ